VFYLVSDPLSERWVKSLRPTARSLVSCYLSGRPRGEAYERMIETILAPVRSGHTVCVAFYGHPGVSVLPSHEAIRRAREEGFDARMLPGISSEDSMFAELGFDPTRSGCQTYEATDFLVYRRRVDPSSALVLLQAGVVGNLNYSSRPSQRGLRLLAQRLAKVYGRKHEVVLYEASVLPVVLSTIRVVPVEQLTTAGITGSTTLFVPPRPRPPDRESVRSLRLRPSKTTRVPSRWRLDPRGNETLS
jgi:hypothetical protein